MHVIDIGLKHLSKLYLSKFLIFETKKFFFNFFKHFIYLFLKRGERRKRERGEEAWMGGCLLCTPYWGPGPQPGHVHWLGIEPETLWFSGQYSVLWATPARAHSVLWKLHVIELFSQTSNSDVKHRSCVVRQEKVDKGYSTYPYC